jgi:hypothetical protein
MEDMVPMRTQPHIGRMSQIQLEGLDRLSSPEPVR